MTRLPASAVVAVVGLLLAGCATSPPPVPDEAATRIRRVAVISMTAQVLHRQYTGLTVFGNEKEEKDIAAWNIDAAYEDQLAAALVKVRPLEVVRAPYPVAQFAHVNDLDGPWDAPAFRTANWGAVGSAISNHCAANALDAIVFATPVQTGDAMGGSNQFYGGAGLYARGPGDRVSILHLVASVALVDCRTARPIATRRLARFRNANGQPRALPFVTTGPEVSRIPFSAWTATTEQEVRDGLVKLPGYAWEPTIRSLYGADP